MAIVDIAIVDIAAIGDVAEASASFIEAWLSRGLDWAKLTAAGESISPTTARTDNERLISRHRFTTLANTPLHPEKQL